MTKPAPVDLTQFAVKDTADIPLTLGDGETPMVGADGKTPLSVTVYGPGSKQFERAKAARESRVFALMRRKGGKMERTPEETARDTVEFLTAITASWNGGIAHPDAVDESTEALSRAIYADSRIGFIRDKVNEHVGDWGNFSAGSATN